jgi:putative ABC transport system permease protein
MGRLREGISLEQTRASLDALAARRQSEHPQSQTKWAIEVKPANAIFVGSTLASTLWSLQAAVAMLLLIACANVGTPLVARSVARRGEFSIRMAIGAGRSRLVRQLITESLLLAGLSGILGILFAWGGIRALEHFYLGPLPHMRVVRLDWQVLTLTILVSALTGLLFGVAPAWIGSHLSLADALKESCQQQSSGFRQRAFQDGLVVLQLALATVLLVGAGLMVQTTAKLLRVDPGLDPKGLYQVLYDSNPVRNLLKPDLEAVSRGGIARRQALLDWFPKEVQAELLWDESLVEKLSTTPGIESVAISPLGGGMRSQEDFHVEGKADVLQGTHIPIGIRSGDYFKTLRLPLVAGRFLTKEDCAAGLQSVLVNQAFAQQCWPGQDPLNRRIASKNPTRTFVVVGVVKNTLDWRRDTPQLPAVYEPIERVPFGLSRGAFMVRSKLNPEALRSAVSGLGQQMQPPTELRFLTPSKVPWIVRLRQGVSVCGCLPLWEGWGYSCRHWVFTRS